MARVGVSQPSPWLSCLLVSHDNSLWDNGEAGGVLRGGMGRHGEQLQRGEGHPPRSHRGGICYLLSAEEKLFFFGIAAGWRRQQGPGSPEEPELSLGKTQMDAGLETISLHLIQSPISSKLSRAGQSFELNWYVVFKTPKFFLSLLPGWWLGLAAVKLYLLYLFSSTAKYSQQCGCKIEPTPVFLRAESIL